MGDWSSLLSPLTFDGLFMTDTTPQPTVTQESVAPQTWCREPIGGRDFDKMSYNMSEDVQSVNDTRSILTLPRHRYALSSQRQGLSPSG